MIMTMNVKLRPEQPLDAPLIWNVNKVAFGSNVEADLVDALRSGGFSKVSLVAEIKGEIVGHILFSTVTVHHATGKQVVLSLAPMAVMPNRQRMGIGSQLVKAGLNECRKLDFPFVVVLGHPDFYPRFGFSSALARHLESPFGAGEAWMALEITSGSLSGVSGHVKYPQPFEIFLA